MTNITGLTDAITSNNIDANLEGGLADQTIEQITEKLQSVHSKLGAAGPKRLYDMWDIYNKLKTDFHETAVSLRLWRRFWEGQHEWIVAHPFPEPSMTTYNRYYIKLKTFIELDSTITFMSSRLAIKHFNYMATLNVGHEVNRDRDMPPQDRGADATQWKYPNYTFPQLSPDMSLTSIYNFATQAKVWFQSGGENVPSPRIQYSHLMNNIPPEMWLKVERFVNPLVFS